MGAGYNIPVSLSASDAISQNPNQNAGTNINFGSGDLDAGEQTQTHAPYMPSTAVASAANGPSNASADVEAPPGFFPPAGGIPQKWLLIGGAVVLVGIGAAVYYLRKK